MKPNDLPEHVRAIIDQIAKMNLSDEEATKEAVNQIRLLQEANKHTDPFVAEALKQILEQLLGSRDAADLPPHHHAGELPKNR
jgi:hypothetical protein